jgi:hypothetical protein
MTKRVPYSALKIPRPAGVDAIPIGTSGPRGGCGSVKTAARANTAWTGFVAAIHCAQIGGREGPAPPTVQARRIDGREMAFFESTGGDVGAELHAIKSVTS